MSEVIFARTRHNYESYADLHSLINLSGYKTCYVDEIDPQSDNAYIITVLNGEIGAGWAGAKAHIVAYDFEWRREPHAPIPGVKECWTCDKWQAETLGMKYVPVGSHPGLRETESRQDLYDVAYYGYMIPRRQRIQHELRERGLRLSPQAAWGEERDRLLNGSRVFLHVHQWDDIPAVPGLRLVVAAAYKLPVLMESCTDYGAFSAEFYDGNYDELVGMAAELNQRGYDAAMQFMGETLHQKLCVNLTFRKSVEGAL